MAHLALVRSLVSVNSKVIEEVVPFAEVFAATTVVTFKNLDFSLRLGVHEAENLILLSIRYVLLDLN